MNKTVEQLRAELAALESRKKSNAAAQTPERQHGCDVPMTPEQRASQEHSDDIFRMALAGPPYIDRFGVEHVVAPQSSPNRAPEPAPAPAPATEPEPVTPKLRADSDPHRFDKYCDYLLEKLNREATGEQ